MAKNAIKLTVGEPRLAVESAGHPPTARVGGGGGVTISDDVMRIWMRQVKKYLRRYWDHPHYDDIVSEAYLQMWEAIQSADETVRDLKAYAMRAAWFGAQSFLSSRHNEQRTWNVFKRKAVSPTVYLEDIRALHYSEWQHKRLIEPDFAPRLIERLAAEAELAQLAARKRAALILCCLRGLTREEARLQLGWPRWLIDRVLQKVPFTAIPYAHPGCGPGRAGGTRTTFITETERHVSCQKKADRLARNQEIWRRYQHGENPSQIARALGLSVSRTHAIVKQGPPL